ncbi:hypothetical protein DFH07DRAFT_1030446 [Mycena maculata]|uniref:Uncharacterized protein n=1 Tax=Mycena maculata TaxID=230809 RepID=A0AAD7J0X9_9AGAR|nr:hypothetical protein DFH07DRAFT_1030446 [Mycena maculata]
MHCASNGEATRLGVGAGSWKSKSTKTLRLILIKINQGLPGPVDESGMSQHLHQHHRQKGKIEQKGQEQNTGKGKGPEFRLGWFRKGNGTSEAERLHNGLMIVVFPERIAYPDLTYFSNASRKMMEENQEIMRPDEWYTGRESTADSDRAGRGILSVAIATISVPERKQKEMQKDDESVFESRYTVVSKWSKRYVVWGPNSTAHKRAGRRQMRTWRWAYGRGERSSSARGAEPGGAGLGHSYVGTVEEERVLVVFGGGYGMQSSFTGKEERESMGMGR